MFDHPERCAPGGDSGRPRPPHSHVTTSRYRFARVLIPSVSLGISACSTSSAPAPESVPAESTRVSAMPHAAPLTIAGTASLLIHDMTGVSGGPTPASSLLFVPRGAPPAGGWPVIAWAHGTTTFGQKTCAPSLSPDLDGGLTADGLPSHYTYLVGALVDAGYAVVASDYEGLGQVATAPYPYYSAASLARSLIAGVRAAHQVNDQLSSDWVVVGHSEGGRGALVVQAHATEAPELALRGSVAYAPFVAVAAGVGSQLERATSDPVYAANYSIVQNTLAAGLTLGVLAQSPGADLDPIMGADLQQLLPTIASQCSFDALAEVARAVAAKPAGEFAGIRADWLTSKVMTAFLAANDPAAMPGFALHLPTLVVQGSADTLVPEPPVTAFAAELIAARAPVTYHVYEADHSTIITLATPDVLSFLADRFSDASAGL